MRTVPVVVGWDAIWRTGGRLVRRPPRSRMLRSTGGVLLVRLIDLLLVVMALLFDPGVAADDVGLRPADHEATLTVAVLTAAVVVGGVIGLRLRHVREKDAGPSARTFIRYDWYDRLPLTGLLVLTLVVVVPVEEELFFRGVLLGLLLHPLGLGIVIAVLVSATAFAVGHAYQGPVGVPRAFVLGLLLAAAYLATGSIVVSMIVHACLNAVALAVKRMRIREVVAGGDRPLPPWPANSLTVDLIAAYSTRTGRVPDLGPIRRTVKGAIATDLVRWGAMRIHGGRFEQLRSTSGSPQADLQLRRLNGKPVIALGRDRPTDPVLEFLAREMVEAGWLDYSSLQLDQLRYRSRDPDALAGRIDAARRVAEGNHASMDPSGAVFCLLLLETGLVTTSDTRVLTGLLHTAGAFRPILDAMNISGATRVERL